jgi:AcrR family transcriptional regulator
MADVVMATSNKRGRPRSQQAKRALLEATAELLQERDLPAISADDIAQRAGVSKATIYRWWESKSALALDAFLEEVARREGPAPDTGSLRGDLYASLRARSRVLTANPWLGRTMAILVAKAASDPSLREAYLDHVVRPLRAQARVFFDRAIERREIPPDVDVDVALDLTYGAMYHRVFHGHAPLGDRFAETVVDMVVTGIGARKTRR